MVALATERGGFSDWGGFGGRDEGRDGFGARGGEEREPSVSDLDAYSVETR